MNRQIRPECYFGGSLTWILIMEYKKNNLYCIWILRDANICIKLLIIKAPIFVELVMTWKFINYIGYHGFDYCHKIFFLIDWVRKSLKIGNERRGRVIPLMLFQCASVKNILQMMVLDLLYSIEYVVFLSTHCSGWCQVCSVTVTDQGWYLYPQFRFPVFVTDWTDEVWIEGSSTTCF